MFVKQGLAESLSCIDILTIAGHTVTGCEIFLRGSFSYPIHITRVVVDDSIWVVLGVISFETETSLIGTSKGRCKLLTHYRKPRTYLVIQN